MKLNRRKTVLGLGAMATGSGAVFSSAAFSSTADANADFRVRVSEDMRVEAGEAFYDGGSVNNGNVNEPDHWIDPEDSGNSGDVGGNFYDSGKLGSVFDSSGEDRSLPLATVSARDEDAVSDARYAGVNDDLEIYVALDEGDGRTEFDGLLQVVNNTNQEQDIGIAYDRNNGQYGDDVDGENITDQDVQQAYQFTIDGLLVSPDPTESNGSGSATDNTSAGWQGDAADAPKRTVSVSANGGKKQINLITDVDQINGLATQAGLDPGFGESSRAVDLLDGITIVADSPDQDPQ